MLDFYAIDDEESWDSPEESRRVGSLSLSEHLALGDLFAELGWGPERPSYFDDQRFTADEIGRVLQGVNARAWPRHDSALRIAIEKVRSILAAAEEQGRGIQTYCD